MTFKEKWNMEHPDRPYKPGNLGPGCVRAYFTNVGLGTVCTITTDCAECWDQEIPESNITVDTPNAYADITYKDPMNIPVVKDSGNRRQFESGAVRDMQEGKGRCDLMPLEVVGGYFGRFYCKVGSKVNAAEQIFNNISNFMKTNDTDFLYLALRNFEHSEAFSDINTMLLEVAKHFEEGAKKYGENNWQKGIPVNCYIDSAVRHYLKWLRGDKDEPHDRAFVWNLMCCIWEVDYREKQDESHN